VLNVVGAHSPQGAASIQHRLITNTDVLQQFPFAGHAITRQGVRRIIVTPYPYLIDYRAAANEIVVLRFRHAARNPWLEDLGDVRVGNPATRR